MTTGMVATRFVQTDYGKNLIKLLHTRKEGTVYYIKELEVCTALTLDSVKDFIYGDNNDVIATDSQKNIVHIVAKQFGIQSIEKFGLRLCDHFLKKYPQLVATNFKIEEYPWKRVNMDGQMHVHAFQFIPECRRICEVAQKRGEKGKVTAGIRDLRVLKTTQSAFKDFVDDEYRTLPYSDHRMFSSIIACDWTYNTTEGFCFDKAWETVKTSILEVFFGPSDKGEYSPCVQHTLYYALKKAMSRVPQMESAEMTLPNKHYFQVDFSRFKKLEFMSDNTEVYTAFDKPSGNIHATIQRDQVSRL